MEVDQRQRNSALASYHISRVEIDGVMAYFGSQNHVEGSEVPTGAPPS